MAEEQSTTMRRRIARLILTALWRVVKFAWLLTYFLIGFEIMRRLNPYGWYWAGIGCILWWMTPYFMLAEFMDEGKEAGHEQAISQEAARARPAGW